MASTLITGRNDGLSMRLDATGWPLIPPTLVTIERSSPADVGARQIVCSVDGVQLAQLFHGRHVTHEILPGPHVLRVHNTFFRKSLSFDAEPGEHVRFTVWNRAWIVYLALACWLPAPPLLGVERLVSATPWTPIADRIEPRTIGTKGSRSR